MGENRRETWKKVKQKLLPIFIWSVRKILDLLIGENVSKSFGGVKALKGINFYIKKGEILGLIGPNGSGKTTLFNLISGIYKPDSGTIIFENKNLVGMKPYEICRMGISRTFQLIKLFLNHTVLQNVMVGINFGREKPISFQEAKVEAAKILERVGLTGKEENVAKKLSVIDRKKLEIARALATKPKLLLLDEPMAGLVHHEVEEFMKLIRSVNREGITVFLIEHAMKAVMTVSDRVMVFHHGEKIVEGSPEEVASYKKVLEVYLGETYAPA